MSSYARSSLAAAVMLTAASVGGLSSTSSTASVTSTAQERSDNQARNNQGQTQRGVDSRSLFDVFSSFGGYYSGRGGYPNGPGWTAAHVKRMARKSRNQQRHKAASRCRKGR